MGDFQAVDVRSRPLRSSTFLKKVLIINDVAEWLVLSIEAVGAVNGLKETMILHRLVDRANGIAETV